MRRFSAVVAVVPFAGALAQPAYPAKPIRLIVPFPPGGGTDMIARTVAQKMAEQNKWSVVVDNRPGAGGNLGVDAAAKAAPDGYTLVMGQTSNLAINPCSTPSCPTTRSRSLAPVALVSSAPIVMAAPANTPYKTFADWWRRPRPGPTASPWAIRATAPWPIWRASRPRRSRA
jgi:tripartite-type tricarboxylate transporter receptor subunit TctC